MKLLLLVEKRQQSNAVGKVCGNASPHLPDWLHENQHHQYCLMSGSYLFMAFQTETIELKNLLPFFLLDFQWENTNSTQRPSVCCDKNKKKLSKCKCYSLADQHESCKIKVIYTLFSQGATQPKIHFISTVFKDYCSRLDEVRDIWLISLMLSLCACTVKATLFDFPLNVFKTSYLCLSGVGLHKSVSLSATSLSWWHLDGFCYFYLISFSSFSVSKFILADRSGFFGVHIALHFAVVCRDTWLR